MSGFNDTTKCKLTFSTSMFAIDSCIFGRFSGFYYHLVCSVSFQVSVDSIKSLSVSLSNLLYTQQQGFSNLHALLKINQLSTGPSEQI